jgi:hypothetical protein
MCVNYEISRLISWSFVSYYEKDESEMATKLNQAIVSFWYQKSHVKHRIHVKQLLA